jgi:CheY-like chemotaxis protein
MSEDDLKASLKDATRTRHLSLNQPVDMQTMPLRATGPLDDALPWVIEFRVVGTASTIQARVREQMNIGRADPGSGLEPDINLADYGAHVLGVSRNHAAIYAQDSRITISDKGSANGTRLNGYVLRPHKEYRLRHGDELAFGQLQLQVLFAVVPLVTNIDVQDEENLSAVIPKSANGQHVLVVEDDADVASVFAMILEHAGFRVTVVNTATAAIGFISNGMPDAMMLDIMLPDMDGLALARYVRKTQTKHIPMVVISGATGGYQMNQALQAGADLFLGKPVGVDDLVKAFSVLLPNASNAGNQSAYTQTP